MMHDRPDGRRVSSFAQRTLVEIGRHLAVWQARRAADRDDRAGYDAWRIGRAAETLYYNARCVENLHLEPLFATLEVRGTSIVSLLRQVELYVARAAFDPNAVRNVIELTSELDQAISSYREPFMLRLYAARIYDRLKLQ